MQLMQLMQLRILLTLPQPLRIRRMTPMPTASLKSVADGVAEADVDAQEVMPLQIR
jgi:hypothetical protein